jgi:hypothetical protein
MLPQKKVKKILKKINILVIIFQNFTREYTQFVKHPTDRLISRSSTIFSAQLTACFRCLARHFKSIPTEIVRSVLG